MVSATFLVLITIFGLCNLFVGPVLGRVGPRILCLVSAILFFFAHLITALGCFLGNIYVIYLGYGVLGGMSCAFGNSCSIITLQKYYPKQVGLATGIVIAGYGCGALISFPVKFLISEMQIWNVFLVVGSFLFVMQFFFAFFLSYPKLEEPIVKKDVTLLSTVIKGHLFYIFLFVFACNTVSGLAYIPQISQDVKRAGKQESSFVTLGICLMSLGSLSGRLLFGPLASKYGGKYFFFLTNLMTLLMTLLMQNFGTTLWVYYVCLFLIGTFFGGSFSLCPTTLAQVFSPDLVQFLYAFSLSGFSMIAAITFLVNLYLDSNTIFVLIVSSIGVFCSLCLIYLK